MRPKSRFRSYQHPTEKHLKGKTDPEPEFAQVEWLSVIRERQVRLKVKSVKYGVVKKPKTEKPSETKPAYLMQSHHNNSTEQFFNLAATPAYSSIQFCFGASCTVVYVLE